MGERKYIQDLCYRMKVGEAINFSKRLFAIAFPCGWPSMYTNHEQAFLSSMIGSGCGVWRVKYNHVEDYITVSRHEESNKRYYIDPDREHLFKRMPDGTLERRT